MGYDIQACGRKPEPDEKSIWMFEGQGKKGYVRGSFKEPYVTIIRHVFSEFFEDSNEFEFDMAVISARVEEIKQGKVFTDAYDADEVNILIKDIEDYIAYNKSECEALGVEKIKTVIWC